MRRCTRSCSTSLRDLVSAVAGVPSVSSTMSSSLRPATWRPISSRNSSVPLTMSLPIWAKGPVCGARKPIRIGPPWAAGAGGAASAATTDRRRTAASARLREIMALSYLRNAPSTPRGAKRITPM